MHDAKEPHVRFSIERVTQEQYSMERIHSEIYLHLKNELFTLGKFTTTQLKPLCLCRSIVAVGWRLQNLKLAMFSFRH